MSRFRFWLAMPGYVALLAAIGCRSNTCQDAVNTVTACVSKLNGTADLTPEVCAALKCGNKEGFIDCVVELPCTTTEALNAAFSQCLSANACR
jgi:hypothetical protein